MYTSKNKFKNTKRKKFLYAEKSKYFSIKVNESQISMRTSIFVYDLILLLRESVGWTTNSALEKPLDAKIMDFNNSREKKTQTLIEPRYPNLDEILVLLENIGNINQTQRKKGKWRRIRYGNVDPIN